MQLRQVPSFRFADVVGELAKDPDFAGAAKAVAQAKVAVDTAQKAVVEKVHASKDYAVAKKSFDDLFAARMVILVALSKRDAEAFSFQYLAKGYRTDLGAEGEMDAWAMLMTSSST